MKPIISNVILMILQVMHQEQGTILMVISDKEKKGRNKSKESDVGVLTFRVQESQTIWYRKTFKAIEHELPKRVSE